MKKLLAAQVIITVIAWLSFFGFRLAFNSTPASTNSFVTATSVAACMAIFSVIIGAITVCLIFFTNISILAVVISTLVAMSAAFAAVAVDIFIHTTFSTKFTALIVWAIILALTFGASKLAADYANGEKLERKTVDLLLLAQFMIICVPMALVAAL